jgi:hypothetical protein
VQASGTIGAMVADHAERHLFAELPELDAIPRRGLALTLAGVPRAGIASELGLSGAALSAVLAVSRKAVRRTRVELASGGRCERAERALSDRLDAAASEMDKRFLDAHLARCSRCRIHGAELTAALKELQAGLAEDAEPVQEPPKARLRVVPPAPQLPRAPQPPSPREHPPTRIAAPAPARHQRIRAALPVAVAVLIAVGLVAAAIALLSAFGGDGSVRAPWDAPDAPVVHPAPISGQ